MGLDEKAQKAFKEKNERFGAVVELFREAFPGDVVKTRDYTDVNYSLVVKAKEDLNNYIDGWCMGEQKLYRELLKRVHAELTDTVLSVFFSPEDEEKGDDFVNFVEMASLYHQVISGLNEILEDDLNSNASELDEESTAVDVIEIISMYQYVTGAPDYTAAASALFDKMEGQGKTDIEKERFMDFVGLCKKVFDKSQGKLEGDFSEFSISANEGQSVPAELFVNYCRDQHKDLWPDQTVEALELRELDL